MKRAWQHICIIVRFFSFVFPHSPFLDRSRRFRSAFDPVSRRLNLEKIMALCRASGTTGANATCENGQPFLGRISHRWVGLLACTREIAPRLAGTSSNIFSRVVVSRRVCVWHLPPDAACKRQALGFILAGALQRCAP
jgi:hypothetical protein